MTGKGKRSGVRLTARGAIALILLATLAGYVLAALFDLQPLIGLAFVSACLLGVVLVNPRELLSLVVTPPLVFFVATLFVELGRALSSVGIIQSLALGLYGSLSHGAPWLFAGSAIVLGVAWGRGLRDNVRDLREELRAGAEAPRPRPPSFVPGPAGYFEPKVYGTPRTVDRPVRRLAGPCGARAAGRSACSPSPTRPPPRHRSRARPAGPAPAPPAPPGPRRRWSRRPW